MKENKIGRVITTDEGPSFTQVDVRLDRGIGVFPGQILFADIGEEGEYKFAVLRVSAGQEINPYENALASQVRDTFNMHSSRESEDLLRKYTIIKTDYLEIITRNPSGGVISSEPSALIPAATIIYDNIADLTNVALGFPNPDEPTSIYLGRSRGNSELKICLDANKVLARHILIAGSTGTGKSYLLGLITEELHRLGIRHINIDVHGELVEATQQLGGTVLVPGRDFTVKLSSLQEPEVMGMLPLNNPLHVDIVTRAFVNLKKEGRSFTVDDYVRECIAVTKQFGSAKNTENIIEARVESLNTIDIIGKGFDWKETLKSKGKLINIDCRGLGQWSLRTVVGAVARELFNYREKGEIEPFVLSMDEAHLFLPQTENATSSQVLSELIRMGRHYGAGIIISSQSPADIDRRISKITNTRFIFAIEPSELAAIKGLLGDAPPELVDNISKLRQGTCILAGSRETVKHTIPIEIRQRQTTDGGVTPLFIKP